MDTKTTTLIEAAIAKRKPLRKITNALRLVNGIGDDLPGLVIEQYDDHCVIHLFQKQWIAQAQVLSEFIKARLDVRYLIIKQRLDSKAVHSEKINAGVWIEEASSQAVVRENALDFAVDLNDGLNSGLFLDMRRNRKLVAGLLKRVKVLNCFAYTCSFGVYARAAGASGVVNVDISRKNLQRGRKNYALNGLDCTDDEFVRADALGYMNRAVKKNNRFGCVILDPPSFARKDTKIFTVKKDMPALIEAAMKILDPGGVLLAATNFSGLSHGDLEAMVRAAGKDKIRSVKPLGQDVDFCGTGSMPESYLAAVLVKIGKGSRS